jgi:nucleoside phosphorylase
VLEQINVSGEDRHPAGTIYDTGTINTSDGTIDIAVAEIGAGNSGAAAHVERAVARFEPDLLLFVGIAGGIKDATQGDVIVASKVYGYQAGKDAHKFLSRPESYPLSHSLEQRVRRVIADGCWHQRLAGGDSGGQAFLGPMVAGDVLLRSRTSPLFAFIEEHFNDALAAEMEGRGFFAGAHINDSLPAVVVRGISDTLSDKGTENDARWQPIAARRAAALAIELLARAAQDASPLSEGGRDAVAGVTRNLNGAYYINLPRLLSDSALNLLSNHSRAALRQSRSWVELDPDTALRLRGLCERALEEWPAPALSLAQALDEGAVGVRVAFDGHFRTRNWKSFDPAVGHTGDMEQDPHVYLDVGSRRVYMPVDPAWATTSTGRLAFTNGQIPFSGLGLLRRVDEESALVSPYVLAPSIGGRKVEAEMWPQ